MDRRWLAAAAVAMLVLGLAGPRAGEALRVEYAGWGRLPFDPEVWRSEADLMLGAQARGQMLRSLLGGGRFKGMSLEQVRALLGDPSVEWGPGSGGGDDGAETPVFEYYLGVPSQLAYPRSLFITFGRDGVYRRWDVARAFSLPGQGPLWRPATACG